MLGKLIILKFEGDFEQGFRVSLEVSQEGDRPFLEASGALPANPELVTRLHHWQQSYRSLDVASRIKPKEIFYGGSIQQMECRRWAQELGQSLTRWLASDAFAAIDKRLREALSLNEPIRILIRTEDRNLRHLPWHLWDLLDRYTQAEVGFCASIAQRIEVHDRRKGKVRILAILGNSRGIDIQADRQLLASLPDAAVQFLVEPQRHEINDRLWNQPWDILFFAGHSETNAQQGRIFINDRESLTLDELRYGLRQAIAQGLRLAIFNSCDGLGLVSQLEQVHLPCAIAMREPVPDRIAQEFLKQFLIAFAAGDSLYLAVRRSRERLQGWEGNFPCASWLPVICQNASESPSTWQSLRGATLRRQSDRDIWKRVKVLLLIAALVTSLIVGVRSIGWLQRFELRAFDQLVQRRLAEPPDDRILIVSVSEADIQYQDQMGMARRGSLSDRALLQVIQRLQPYQPRAIGLDIYHDFPFEPELAQALKETPGFVAICKVSASEDNPSIAPPPGIAPAIGFSDAVTDFDGVMRRQLLGMTASEACPTSLSLSLQMALSFLASENIAPPQRNPAGEVVIGDVRFPRLAHHSGGYQLAPTEANGYQILLNYRSAAPPQISLRDLLGDASDSQLADRVRDRLILIGVTADNNDVHATPYRSSAARRTAGVIIHAQMISQIISAVLDRRPLLWWWPEWAECLWIGIWAIAGGMVALGWQWLAPARSWRLWLAVVVGLGALYGCCALVLLRGGWIPIVPAAIAFLVTAAGLAIGSSTNRSHHESTVR
ncbi:CHASE2 domain-containing protein [Microcoleus sp. FACHB-1515]|nr:CHASE2 domain-containing protein [Microcoleus sp. FACHB-1515]